MRPRSSGEESISWDRVKELFYAALELPPEAREGWLASMDLGGELREELSALLSAHQEAESDARDGDGDRVGEQMPRRIGAYRVRSLLGEGGFGSVYLADQERPVQRRVALKLLRAGMESRQVLARFALEREALARMSHPNIAQIFDAGTTDEKLPYFAMELVDGPSLTRYAAQEHLPVELRLQLFAQVCRGVHHAHQKGIIHRDLKPSNVLVATVDRKPVPKIIDFGIAKATLEAEAEETLEPRTLAGRCIGSPGYMSPEQADLRGGNVDVRSDVYSLGVLLYELLTSRLPHEIDRAGNGGLLGYLERVREIEPQRPSSAIASAEQATARERGTTLTALRRRLRGDLDWIALKALARDPDRRYPSADAFAEDVERHLRHEPVRAGPPSLSYWLRKLVRRHRVVAATSIVVVSALITGLALALWQNRLARAALTKAIGHRLSAQAVNLTEESPTLALLLAIEGAELAPGEAADAALYRALGAHHELRSERLHDGTPRWAAFSADEQRLLSGDESGLVLCIDLRNGAVLHRFDRHEHRLTALAVDHAGTRGLSADEAGNVLLLDLVTGEELRSLRHPRAVRDAAFLPAANEFLTACDDGALRRYDAACREQVLSNGTSPITALALDREGRRVALLRDESALTVLDLASGAPVLAFDLGSVERTLPDERSRLAFTDEGRFLVCWRAERPLEIVDLDDLERSWRPSESPCTAFALAARAGVLAVCERSGRNFVVDLNSRAIFELPAQTGRYMAQATIDPEGRTLATLAHNQARLHLWDPILGRHLAAIRGPGHAFYAPRVGAAGSSVDVLGHSGSVNRYRTAVFDEQRRWAQEHARGNLQDWVILPSSDEALTWEQRPDGTTACRLLDAVSGTPRRELGTLRTHPPSPVLAPRCDAVLLDRPAETELIALDDGHRLGGCGGHVQKPRCNAVLTRVVGLVGGRVQLFEMPSGTLRFDRAIPGVQCADVDDDGARLLTADGGANTATLWDVASGEALRTIQHRAFVFDVRFTADGRSAISLANDATACVTDLASGRVAQRFGVPTAEYGWLSRDAAGRFVAVLTVAEVSVFDLATGQRRLRLGSEGEEGFARAEFGSDGSVLYLRRAGGFERRIPMDPLSAARALAPRTLTSAERANFELPATSAASSPDLLATSPSSRVLVEAAIAELGSGDRRSLPRIEAWLQRAAELRPRLQPRHHLARACFLSRRAEWNGTEVDSADAALALADLAQWLASEGATARIAATMPELAALRRVAGFEAVVAGSAR